MRPNRTVEDAQDGVNGYDGDSSENALATGPSGKPGQGIASTKSESSVNARECEHSNVVGWDGPDDSENPVNWPSRAKFANVAIVSGLTFVTPLASSMFAPGVPEIMAEFESSNTLLAGFVVSVYVLGFAVGPLVLAPLSELYGRVIVYNMCNIGFVIFTVACAVSTNFNMLVLFRFFEGCFGAAPVTIGGGTIADLIQQEKRGGVLAIYAMGPLLGPVLGPVAGGYLNAAKGWRWVFWVLAMVGGFFAILSALFLRETYPIVLLKRKASRLRQLTGNASLRSEMDSGLTPKQLFIRNLIRPTRILIFSPIVLVCSLYIGVAYGYLYLMFSTFTFVFQGQYHFPTSTAGLSFLGIGIGLLVGLGVIGITSDKILRDKASPSSSTSGPSAGTLKPEYRLPPLVPGAVLIPAGLFMYGWSAEAHTHWLVPIAGTTIVGLGIITVFMCTTMYLVDAFTIYAASALAANTVVRCVMGAVLPLAGQSMYDTLGLGWGNSLLGFIAVICIPVPWVLIKYGERLRNSFDATRL